MKQSSFSRLVVAHGEMPQRGFTPTMTSLNACSKVVAHGEMLV